MRKTPPIFLGAMAGAGFTFLVTQPRIVNVGSSAEAALSDTYQQLNLFGEVFERVRAAYVEKPDDNKLVQSAINGMLAGLDPHSATWIQVACAKFRCRLGRVWRTWYRGHDGRRSGEGGGAD